MSVFLLFECIFENSSLQGKSNLKCEDTIQITMTLSGGRYVDTTIYTWPFYGNDPLGFNVTFEKPLILDTIPKKLIWGEPVIFPLYPIRYLKSPIIESDTVKININLCIDTFKILDTNDITFPIYDTVYVPLSPNDAKVFLENNGPWFINPDSIIGLLNTLKEGYHEQIIIPAMHYKDDGSFVYLISNPEFIKYFKHDIRCHTIRTEHYTTI